MVAPEKSLLPYQWPVIDDVDLHDLRNAVESLDLSFSYSADSVYAFEKKFSRYIHSDFCLAVNSGTSALYISFMCLGLTEGDVVLAPTYTFPSSVMPLLHLGVRVKFVDTNPRDLRMNLDALERLAADKHVKAIIVSHMDGIPEDMEKICRIASLHNLFIIEDCAQAFGAKIQGKSVGTFGDIGIFSLQSKKMTPGGEGGVLVTASQNIYEKAILYSYLQKRSFEDIKNEDLRSYAYTGWGHNLRIHPLAAVLASNKLDQADEYLASMGLVFGKLRDSLKRFTTIQFIDLSSEMNERSFFSFKFLFDIDGATNRSAQDFVAHLVDAGINATISQTSPLHSERIFKDDLQGVIPIWRLNDTFGVNVNDDFSNIERLVPKLIRIPAYFGLNERDIQFLIQTFEKFLENAEKGISREY